jgi:quinol-cytochrome oxidoreductase complex cytochrome b subunit
MQRNWTASLFIALLVMLQSACVVVGYSSRGGWSVWPGGLGLLLMLAVAFFLFSSLLRR